MTIIKLLFHATIVFYKKMVTGEFVKNMLKIVQKKEIGK